MKTFHRVTVSYHIQLKYHQIFLSVKSESVVKSVNIRNYSGPYYPAFGLNTDQNNSEYGHFLHSVNEQDDKTLWWTNLNKSKTEKLNKQQGKMQINYFKYIIKGNQELLITPSSAL